MQGPSYWIYVPIKGAPIAFAILFLISGVLHAWQNVLKFRSWRIGFLFPWAAALFVAGFALREYGAYNHYWDANIADSNANHPNLSRFIASTVLLFVAPPVYSGALYFIFGRVLYYLPYLAPMHPGRVWTTFIAMDAIVGIVAGNGASLASNTSNSPSKRRTGYDLAKASLIIQLGMFVAFVSLVRIGE
jgi:RTA1 like protein